MKFSDMYENDNGNVVILPMDTTLRVVLEINPLLSSFEWQYL